MICSDRIRSMGLNLTDLSKTVDRGPDLAPITLVGKQKRVFVLASFDQRNHLYEFDEPTIKIEMVTFDEEAAAAYKEKWGAAVQLIETEMS